MIFTACTLVQFNDLPHYRWVSLPGRNELKIGKGTVGVKINGECSYKTFKDGREAHTAFEALLRWLR